MTVMDFFVKNGGMFFGILGAALAVILAGTNYSDRKSVV